MLKVFHFAVYPCRDLESIIDWPNCRTAVYDKIVMVLLQTFLNALCRNILVPIRTIQRWDTAGEPKVASH